jgi:hypothetical protein
MGVKWWGSAKNVILKEIGAVEYTEVPREKNMWNGSIDWIEGMRVSTK